MSKVYYIKFRERRPPETQKYRRFYFMSSKGGANRLRVHAAQFYTRDEADAAVKEFTSSPENAHLEFRVTT